MESDNSENTSTGADAAQTDERVKAISILRASPSWLPVNAQILEEIHRLPARFEELAAQGLTQEQANCELGIEAFDIEAQGLLELISDHESLSAYLVCLRELYNGKLRQFARIVVRYPKPVGINEEFWQYATRDPNFTERIIDPLGSEILALEVGLQLRRQHWTAEAYRRVADLGKEMKGPCIGDKEETSQTFTENDIGRQDSPSVMAEKQSLDDLEARWKGSLSLIEGKRAVAFLTAERYLGISDRQRQNLMKTGALEVEGQGSNRKITTASLIA